MTNICRLSVLSMTASGKRLTAERMTLPTCCLTMIDFLTASRNEQLAYKLRQNGNRSNFDFISVFSLASSFRERLT